MIADRVMVRTFLASPARTLHVGIIADRLFNPSITVCFKHKSGRDGVAPS